MGTSEWRKLHQFIEEHAKENLKKHLAKVTALLESATGVEDFYVRFAAVFYGQHQPFLRFSADAPSFEEGKGKFSDEIKERRLPTDRLLDGLNGDLDGEAT